MVIIYHIIISLNRTIKSSKSIAEPSFFFWMKNDPESKKIYSIVVVVGIVIVIAGLLKIFVFG